MQAPLSFRDQFFSERSDKTKYFHMDFTRIDVRNYPKYRVRDHTGWELARRLVVDTDGEVTVILGFDWPLLEADWLIVITCPEK